jgi:transcriptional regulator with XRE-family HTH domain
MDTAKKIKKIRLNKKLSQKGMADRLGVALRTYQYYERGEREAPTDFTVRLMKEFNVNPIWFLSSRGEMFFAPMAPAMDVALRMIRALYFKQYSADSKSLPPAAVFYRYLHKLEEETGLTPGFFSLDYLNDPESTLPCEVIDRFCFKRGISLDWLYSGAGEMLRSQRTKSSPVDLVFLKEIINAVEGIFQKEDLHLSPKKKAELITLLYDELIGESLKESLLKGKVIKFVKLAS